MSQHSNKTKGNHQVFIKKICETGVVWCLKNRDGLAMSNSAIYEDRKGEPIGLFCFWSEKNLAQACVLDNWDDYTTTQISLSEFIEDWCLGISNDGYMVGSDFDQNMVGSEVDALDLIIALSKELKAQKKEIKLKKFDHINTLVDEIEMLG